MAGGRTIKYWSNLTLDLRKHSIGPGDPIEKEKGVKIGVTVKKNHCCPERFPYVKLEYYAIFGQGIEVILSALNEAIRKGICESKGAWIRQYDLNTGEEVNKWNGKVAFRNYMEENPDEFEAFSTLVYGGMKLSDSEIADIKAEDHAIEEAITEDEVLPKKIKQLRKKSEGQTAVSYQDMSPKNNNSSNTLEETA